MGLLLAVIAHGGYWPDHDGAEFVLHDLKGRFKRLKVVFVDSAYARRQLPEWVRNTFGSILQTVLRPVEATGFVVLPRRRIVERTFAWLNRCQRHVKDYEETTASAEAITYIAMINLMSRRLAKL